MIIEPTNHTDNGVNYNILTHTQDFYACMYNVNNEIVFVSTDGSPLQAGTKVFSQMSCFGSESFLDLQNEIEARELISQ